MSNGGEFRDALKWDRILIAGIGVIVIALAVLVAWQLNLLREDIVDIRIAATALSMRVDTMDAHGTRALAEHRLEAHDRAK